MIAAVSLLFLAAAAPRIGPDQSPVRSGCSADDPIVARLPAGQPIEIRFSVAGGAQPCFKILTQYRDKDISGYVLGSALASVESFEEARRAGAGLDLARSQAASIAPATDSSDVAAKAVTLLDQQPAEALRLIEQIMPRAAPQAELLTLAGIAAYRSDQLKEAAEYLRQSQALKADPQTAALLARVEHERQADHSGSKLFATRFLLRYDGTSVDSAAAHSIVTVLEQEYSRISDVLGCQGTERIITVVQTPEAYRRTTGAAEWSGGQYDGRIRIPLADTDPSAPSARRVFAHEIVHACLAGLGQYPTWLHEGMAQKFSGDTLPEADRQAVRALVKAGKVPPLRRLPNRWGALDSTQASVAYRYALEAVDTLLSRYQGLGIANVLRNPAMLTQVTAGIEQELAK